ncbi:MAG TPA: DUF4082 domain-containing protein [Gaiellaceae bacterium]|nr:DUF4082 domain-containing protein [Gaiellaceae bacterium]
MSADTHSRLRGRQLAVALAAAAVFACALGGGGGASAASTACELGSAVACENQLPGSPRSEWDVDGSGDPTIQGFPTDISVDQGGTVDFKIKTPATAYHVDIYRLGWYGGDGARKVATIQPTAALPQAQPACAADAATGLVDCGNWSVSASWSVPADAVSGVYLARPVRDDTGGASHILFVVRDDDGGSEILFQTADTTWQAYNRYGGNSLYFGSPAGRAYKVSYNRPITTRDYNNTSYFFNGELPLLRWIERNGYDVSYSTDVDSDRRGAEIREHELFVSAGHDEYWSGGQRANVTAARDAGVNLAFFSGNEVFWKVRWENSIDGSGTSHRTLVCYKETAAGAKIDPSPEWTGTWRDARFSPPSDGGRPENALTGTLFTVNAYREDALTVPATDGRLRFWRGTSVASLAPGEVATFPAGILGHEWDEDVDNGSRPAGLFNVSTTTLSVDKHLVDEGTRYVAGTATHHLSLYRASSGALVFGAGTVQWGWGLDDVHDVYSNHAPLPPDQRLQQATVNLFADMGVQPASLQADLSPATASSDASAPVSGLTSPAAGTTVASGSTVTLSGVASDASGAVAAVEVSTDGGATWHPASGREQWTYTWHAGGYGTVTIKTRAVDDSGNLETPGAGTTIDVGCPCSLWTAGAVPGTPSSNDRNAVELGVRFTPQVNGFVTGLRFYKGPQNAGTHVGSLWTNGGTLLGRATFVGETGTGWQQVLLDAPVAVTAGTTYVASYFAPAGGYAVDLLGFRTATVNPPLTAPADGTSGANGVYRYTAAPAFPSDTYSSSNYWVDVVFETSAPPDTTPPIVSGTTPVDGATGADPTGDVTASFSEPVDAGTVNGTTFQLRDAAGTAVPATVSYDEVTRTARLRPGADLATAATYTATVRGGSAGVKDPSGNALATDETWSFTTASGPVCPCTLWPASTTPSLLSSSDANAVELGVRFQVDVPGWITGVRFYKGSRNTGTHVGSLWTNGGSLLARATFGGESSGGWQEVSFGAPVAVSPGETYVASYFAPSGGYALNSGYFASEHRRPPLRAIADGAGGRNGVYRYAASPTFPADTYGAANYWVDVVFSTEAPGDTTPPAVTATSPVAGATDVATGDPVTATFGEALDPASLTASTFTLRDAGGTAVPATVSYDTATTTARLVPSAELTGGATYTATLAAGSSGIKDLAGNALAAPVTWSFTVATCPCSIWPTSARPQLESSSDTKAVELGVRFRSDVGGWITGVRFYKGPQNTGTHVGSLWTNGGTLLGRATFTDETASGWQQVTFGAPVAVTAGTTYVASYFAPAGRYSLDSGYFASADRVRAPLRALRNGADGANGVFRYGSSPAFPNDTYGAGNYWVDVVFDAAPPGDTQPPLVASVSPPAGAASAAVDASVRATFNEPVDAATVSGTTFELRDASGAAIAASVGYDASTMTAALAPSSPLAYGATYTATVRGGSGGVKDVAGNAMASDSTWTFTTKTCPCSIFSVVEQPEILTSSDTKAVELGVKFQADVNGSITGIRFYKGAGNLGTHVASLWTPQGLLLASATFTGETASGWQEATFASPVPVTAGTTYVASYYAPSGRYSLTPGGLRTARLNAPLRALADGAQGGNGVFAYGPASAFPTDTYGGGNYWVDVVFMPGS